MNFQHSLVFPVNFKYCMKSHELYRSMYISHLTQTYPTWRAGGVIWQMTNLMFNSNCWINATFMLNSTCIFMSIFMSNSICMFSLFYLYFCDKSRVRYCKDRKEIIGISGVLSSYASGGPHRMCRKSIGSGQMGNLHNPIKFMTFHATFKIHGKNKLFWKFVTL